MKRKKKFLKKSPVIIISLLCLFICCACSKDSPNLNQVRVQVVANTDEPVRIYGIGGSPEAGIVIRESFDSTFKAEYDGISIDARCKDENTLITIKVWVNGKLYANVSGNKYLTSGYVSFNKR